MGRMSHIVLCLRGLLFLTGAALMVVSNRGTEPIGRATGEAGPEGAPPMPVAAAPQGQAEPGTYLSQGELGKIADLAIHGVVRSVQGRVIDEVPFQEAIVDVRRVLQPKGKELAQATVLVYGGEAGEEGTRLAGAPQFSVGQEVVLYLRTWGPGHVLVGIQQGLYTVVEKDGRKVAVRDFTWIDFIGDDAKEHGAFEETPLEDLLEEPKTPEPAVEPPRPEPPKAAPPRPATQAERVTAGRGPRKTGPREDHLLPWAMGLLAVGLFLVVGSLTLGRRGHGAGGFTTWRLLAIVAAAAALGVALAPSARAYTPITNNTGTLMIRWNLSSRTAPVDARTKSVKYAVLSLGSDDVPDTSEMTAVANAAAQWTGLATAAFRWLRIADDRRRVSQMSSSDRKCVVYWLETTTLDPHGFDMAGALARTPFRFTSAGAMVDADVAFNGFNFQWATGGNVSGKRDIGSVAAHELGHAAGMEHSAHQAASMKPVAPNFDDTSARSIALDDVIGLSKLYPNAVLTGQRGRIVGTLKTVSNRNVHSAIVSARDATTGVVVAAVLSRTAEYEILGLAPGSYVLSTQALGRSMSDEAMRYGTFQSTGATLDAKSDVLADRNVPVGAGQSVNVPLVMSDGTEAMKIDFVVTRFPGSNMTRGNTGPVLVPRGTQGLVVGFIGQNLPTTAGDVGGLSFGSADVTVVSGPVFNSPFASSITCTVNVSATAEPGPRAMELRKADGSRVIGIGAFEIVP